MANGLTFEIVNIILQIFFTAIRILIKMAYAKFQINRFKIDGEIAENHAILINLTASIAHSWKIAIIPSQFCDCCNYDLSFFMGCCNFKDNYITQLGLKNRTGDF